MKRMNELNERISNFIFKIWLQYLIVLCGRVLCYVYTHIRFAENISVNMYFRDPKIDVFINHEFSIVHSLSSCFMCCNKWYCCFTSIFSPYNWNPFEALLLNYYAESISDFLRALFISHPLMWHQIIPLVFFHPHHILCSLCYYSSLRFYKI